MPTSKPRLQVTLTTAQHELLMRLAKLQGRSMSSIVSELFEQVLPVLERVAVVLQAAVRAQESMKQGLRESTEQAERDLRPHVAAALGQLDLLQMDAERASRPPEKDAAGGRSAAAGPRQVTRGSGTGGKHVRTPARAIRPKVKSAKRRARQ